MAAHPARGFGNLKYTIEFNPAMLNSKVDAAARAAIVLTGNYIKAESNAVAPLRDGAMIGSSRADPSGTKVEVSYNTIYAHRQHEETGWNHPNGRQAKYLQSVMENPATLDMMVQYFSQQMGLK